MSVTLRNVNLHSFALTVEARGRGTGSRIEDREERRFLTTEDGEDSAAGSSQRTCFVESSTELIQRLATLRKRKQRSQCTKEAKSKRAKENKKNFKGRKHVVESLHKQGINYARFHVRFNRSPSDALARRGVRHHAHAYS